MLFLGNIEDHVSSPPLTYKPWLAVTLELSHTVITQAPVLTGSRVTLVYVNLTLGP